MRLVFRISLSAFPGSYVSQTLPVCLALEEPWPGKEGVMGKIHRVGLD